MASGIAPKLGSPGGHVEARLTRLTEGQLFRKTLVVSAAIGTAVILWRLTDLILLLAASALVAFIFYKFTLFLERKLKLRFVPALVLAVVLPLLFLITAFGVFGTMIATQFAILGEQLPKAVTYVQDWLKSTAFGQELLSRVGTFMPDGSRILAFAQSFIGGLGTAVTALLVVLVAGVYLAAQPQLYGMGVMNLLPPASRARTLKVFHAVGESLSAWLKAQGISMIFVGIFTGIALSIIGIPAAPALGVIAGLCEFVPYLGTIMVAIPAVILGFAQSPETGIWTAVALVAVQQVQGNVVTPLIQSRMAELPPALTIFSLFAFGIIMGPMGVILAVPLTVVGVTLVRQFVDYPPFDPAEVTTEEAALLTKLDAAAQQRQADDAAELARRTEKLRGGSEQDR